MPPANNKYQVRAVWPGNSVYPQTSSSAMLVVKPLGDLIVGFSSNSSITDLNFNQTTQVLTFTAEGPDGTEGYVNIKLKKTLDVNPQNIIVFMDNKTVPYSIVSFDQDLWLLAINYTHSTHSMLVALFGSTEEIPELPAAFLPVFLVLLIFFVAIIVKRLKVTLN